MNDLLEAVLDTLIPPGADGHMPGAGSLGLADAVRAQTAGAAEVVEAGLAAAAAAGFRELDLEGRVAVLRELEVSQPAFVMTLYVPTCMAYYQHSKVLVGLGLRPGPPHPKGYEVALDDLAALERVRARGRLFRVD